MAASVATGTGMPVPVSPTNDGPPGVLPAMRSVALAGPNADGAKTMPIAHSPPAPTGTLQLLEVRMNPAPTMSTPETTSGALPVLRTCTRSVPEVVPSCVAGKASADGETDTVGAGMATPSPVRPAACGLPGALLATVRLPVRVPATSGVKVTLIAQPAPGARDAGQLLLCAKSPPVPIAEIASGSLPLLVSVSALRAGGRRHRLPGKAERGRRERHPRYRQRIARPGQRQAVRGARGVARNRERPACRPRLPSARRSSPPCSLASARGLPGSSRCG